MCAAQLFNTVEKKCLKVSFTDFKLLEIHLN